METLRLGTFFWLQSVLFTTKFSQLKSNTDSSSSDVVPAITQHIAAMIHKIATIFGDVTAELANGTTYVRCVCFSTGEEKIEDRDRDRDRDYCDLD